MFTLRNSPKDIIGKWKMILMRIIVEWIAFLLNLSHQNEQPTGTGNVWQISNKNDNTEFFSRLTDLVEFEINRPSLLTKLYRIKIKLNKHKGKYRSKVWDETFQLPSRTVNLTVLLSFFISRHLPFYLGLPSVRVKVMPSPLLYKQRLFHCEISLN